MKTKRQAKILELIKKNNIETQEELSDYLEISGNAGNGFEGYSGIEADKGGSQRGQAEICCTDGGKRRSV